MKNRWAGLLGLWLAAPAAAGTLRALAGDVRDLGTAPVLWVRAEPMQAAAVGAGLGAAFLLDRPVRGLFAPDTREEQSEALRRFGDAVQLSGPIVGTALLAGGWAAGDRYAVTTGWLMLETFALSGAAETVFKHATDRTRPNSTGDPFDFGEAASGSGAFPSGHTTTAFAAAATLSLRYPGWKVAVPAYGAAAATAFSRVNSSRHWLSDVVAGGLLGYGVARVVTRRRGEADWTVGLAPGGGVQALASVRF